MARERKYFDSLKDATISKDKRKLHDPTIGVYRIKFGRHKGQWFVGSYLEFINIY